MGTLSSDVRKALRLLAKDRGYSATVLTTLAVCIGANVAIFSVIYAVLFEPLPYPEADRLVNVFNSYPGAGAPRASAGSVDFFMMRERISAFEDVALVQEWGSTVGEPGSIERVRAVRVTPSFFTLLRLDTEVGRGFTEDEMEEGNHQKVVLTNGYWQERFAGSLDAVGRDLRVDGQPFSIVGVLPPDFSLVGSEEARLLFPIPFTEESRNLANWHSNNYDMVARLAPGATIEVAAAQIAAMNNALIEEWPVPNAAQLLADAQHSTQVVDATDDLVRGVEGTLYMLWAGVGLILLIGCVNIANLSLARAQTRVGELATKLALGARRGQVAKQLLTESAVVGVVGGLLGLGVGALGLQLVSSVGADSLPRGAEIGINLPVVLFTLAVAVGAGLAFGAIPVTHVMRSDLSGVFRAAGRTGTASRRAVLIRSSLVTGQVALAFVMLIGAGLMLMSFRAALQVDPGFESEGVLTAYVSLPAARYPDRESRVQFLDELVARTAGLPGVEATSVTNQLPFGGSNSSSIIFPEGYVLPPGESILSPRQNRVGPGYFEAMGIEVLEGREFDGTDVADQPGVIIIDEWLARRYWPDSSPIGRRMVWGQAPGMDELPEDAFFTIVGVVGSIKHRDLTAADSEHVGAYYFTYRQGSMAFVSLVARVATEPTAITPAIREVVTEIDADLPLFGVATMQSLVDDSLVSRRGPMLLLLIFGVVALFLAVVGIYGALSYSVTQRSKEVGIRVAVGSAPRDVFALIVAQGAKVTLFGLILGAVVAIGLARFVQSLLFDVQPTEPVLMAIVALVLGSVGLAACVVPAYRATRVDPISALSQS